MNTPFLIGEAIYLRPFEPEDLAIIRTHMNDPEVRALTGEAMPTSQAAADGWMQRVNQDQSRVWFAIVRKEDDRVIGECGLLRIFHPWRTSDLSIIIGDTAARGSGHGTEAIHLLLDYAFGALALHRISIGVVGFNAKALRFYAKIGFRKEGIQRDGYFYNHQFHDFIMMSILEDEFRGRKGEEA